MTEQDKRDIEEIANRVTLPMDKMLKKQKILTTAMLKYSFELGRKLGYMHGWTEGKKNKPMSKDCTPEALVAFVQDDFR